MFSRGMEKQHRAVMGQNYNINIIYKNKLFYYIDLRPFTSLLELLVINQNSSEERFCSSVVEAFPCAGCFTTCLSAHFSAVEMNNAIGLALDLAL